MKMALAFVFTLYAALKRFISFKSDNSVHNVIIIGNKCFLWENHVLKVLFHADLSIINIVCLGMLRSFVML